MMDFRSRSGGRYWRLGWDGSGSGCREYGDSGDSLGGQQCVGSNRCWRYDDSGSRGRSGCGWYGRCR